MCQLQIVIAVELVDVKEVRKIFIERPTEFWVASGTAGIVVFGALFMAFSGLF